MQCNTNLCRPAGFFFVCKPTKGRPCCNARNPMQPDSLRCPAGFFVCKLKKTSNAKKEPPPGERDDDEDDEEVAEAEAAAAVGKDGKKKGPQGPKPIIIPVSKPKARPQAGRASGGTLLEPTCLAKKLCHQRSRVTVERWPAAGAVDEAGGPAIDVGMRRARMLSSTPSFLCAALTCPFATHTPVVPPPFLRPAVAPQGRIARDRAPSAG